MLTAPALIGLVLPIGHLDRPATGRAPSIASPATVAPTDAVRIGELARSQVLHLELALAPRDPSGLAALARAVTTPGSPTFRDWLAPGAFAKRFGATGSVVERLRTALQRDGLRAGALSANHLELSVSGTVGALERTFSTSLSAFRSRDGRIVYANTTAARAPDALAGAVTAVFGLDDMSVEAPTLVRLDRPSRAPAVLPDDVGPAPTDACAGAIGAAGLSANAVAGAYGLEGLYANGDLGQGTTIAVIEFSTYDPADLSTYESCYSPAPDPAITPVPVLGSAPDEPSSMLEAELDLEDLIGLAPAASLLVYEGSGTSAEDAYATYAAAIGADRAQVVTTSWGSCEYATSRAEANAEDTLFAEAALQGQTVVAASGDHGSEDCLASQSGPSSSALAVDDPASQPYVTGVGGTTLSLSSARTESTWDSPGTNPGAGGGGVSSLWPMPDYQLRSPVSLGVREAAHHLDPCSARSDHCREVPDVAANAGSPYAIYCSITTQCPAGGGWVALGGTSAAAPVWAAVASLADASVGCAAVAPVGFLNPALYAIAAGTHGSSALNDVTIGSNDLTLGHGGDWTAGPGYDLATGLGTPNSGDGSDEGLVAQLCSVPVEQRAAGTNSLPSPIVTGVFPAAARGGHTRITITGRNFVGVTTVRFGRFDATSFTVVSNGTIRATAPRGSGTVHLLVATRAGRSSRSASSLFHFVDPPEVTAVGPDAGPARGGTVVVLSGRYLGSTRAVLFGTRRARSFVVRSSRQVLAVAPSGSGRVPVRVVTSAGVSAARGAPTYAWR